MHKFRKINFKIIKPLRISLIKFSPFQNHEGWEVLKIFFEIFVRFRLDHIVVFVSLKWDKRRQFRGPIATLLTFDIRMTSAFILFVIYFNLWPSSIHMHFYLIQIVWSANRRWFYYVFNYYSSVTPSGSICFFFFLLIWQI